jgi:DNA repair photolyase
MGPGEVMTVLNKADGNMFEFVTHTWNPLGGHCSHECPYCYMAPMVKRNIHKGKYEGIPRIFQDKMGDLGKGHKIFVCNCTDLFAQDVRGEIIEEILHHAMKFDNEYLLLTKNPTRYISRPPIPSRFTLGTTIECLDNTDNAHYGKAPPFAKRLCDIKALKGYGNKTMISIEPIMKFASSMGFLIQDAKPDYVAIGANSGNVQIPEPTRDEVFKLINYLEAWGVKVIQKPNLKRITGASQ